MVYSYTFKARGVQKFLKRGAQIDQKKPTWHITGPVKWPKLQISNKMGPFIYKYK